MPRLPRWFTLPTLLLGALTALWGLVGVGLAVALPQTPVWTLAGFEASVAIAGVLGLTLGLGHHRQAPGLALACIAGTVLLASFLGHRGSAGTIANFSLRPWLMGRLALGAVLAVLAALVVLTRNRKSWPALFKGVAFGAAPALIALMLGLAAIGYGRPLPSPASPAPEFDPDNPAVTTTQTPQVGREPVALDSAVRAFLALPVLKAQKGGLEAGRIVLLTALGIVLIGLTSAGGHYVVKAFQLGAFPDPGTGPDALGSTTTVPSKAPVQPAAASSTT